MKSRQTGALARLARACALHPRRTIAAWVALLVVAIFSSATFGGRLVNEFTIPGSETQQATDLLKSRFTSLSGDSAMVVFTSENGLTNDSAKVGITAAREAAAKVPHVVSVGDAYAQKAGGISKDGTIGSSTSASTRPPPRWRRPTWTSSRAPSTRPSPAPVSPSSTAATSRTGPRPSPARAR